MANGNKLAVVAKYKEKSKTWYKTLRYYGYTMMIFNKYEGKNLLPNVGREGHTYLYYIVNNYSNLPDEILFTQYDPIDHFKQNSIFNITDKHSNWYRFLNGRLYDFISIRPTDFDYEVRHRNIDWIYYCQNLFPEFTEKNINQLIYYGSNINGIFRVSKKAILRRPLNFYEKCLNMLNTEIDPEAGYFFERIWKYIFARYGNLNDKYSFLTNQILSFGSDIFNGMNYSAGVISEKKWKNNAYGHILLHESGCLLYNADRLSLYAHPNETYWLIENDNLILFDAEGSIRHIFHLDNILSDTCNEITGTFFDHDGQIYKRAHWIRPKLFQSKFNFSNLDMADPIT